MPDDTRVDAEAFFRASKALKAAGEKELRKDLNRRLRLGAKPLIGKTRAEAMRSLPSRNGLNRLVAKAPQRVQVRTGKETAGVRVVVAQRAGSAAKAANRGIVRHPVFGRGEWVEQSVPAGWFDETLRREAPSVRPDVEAAIRDTLKFIEEKGR